MTQSSSHHYAEPGTHRYNGGAILSLVCVVLWPLSFLIPVIVNALTSSPKSPGATLPEFADFLLACGFGLLPVVGAAAGAFGLYRAMTQPDFRRTRWLAGAGICLNCLWFFGTFLLSDVGPALANWFQHL